MFDRLLAAVSALSEEEATEPGRVPLPDDEPASVAVAGESYEHYHEHLPTLRTWIEHRAGLP